MTVEHGKEQARHHDRNKRPGIPFDHRIKVTAKNNFLRNGSNDHSHDHHGQLVARRLGFLQKAHNFLRLHVAARHAVNHGLHQQQQRISRAQSQQRSSQQAEKIPDTQPEDLGQAQVAVNEQAAKKENDRAIDRRAGDHVGKFNTAVTLAEQRIAPEHDKPRGQHHGHRRIDRADPSVRDPPGSLDHDPSGQRQIVTQSGCGQQHQHRAGQPERRPAHHA